MKHFSASCWLQCLCTGKLSQWEESPVIAKKARISYFSLFSAIIFRECVSKQGTGTDTLPYVLYVCMSREYSRICMPAPSLQLVEE